MIFHFALPPSIFLNPALSRGPQCQDLRFKRAIISACKAWWLAGVDILYADIVLRRIGQMAALVRMLESPGNDFDNSVRAIRVVFCVSDAYANFAQNVLNRVIDHLTSLVVSTFTKWEQPMATEPRLFRINRPIFHHLLHTWGRKKSSGITSFLSFCLAEV
jgi:hypothetical protein